MPKSAKSARDNRANQLNPTHPAYHQSRGAGAEEAQRMAGSSKPALDNRANQLNPNNGTSEAPRDEPNASTASSNLSAVKPE